MIKIGFIGALTKDWTGGINYFKNLLYALNISKKGELEVYVFIGKKTDKVIRDIFDKYAVLVEDSIFDRNSLKWLIMKIEQKIFKSNLLLERVLKKNSIDILSHSSLTGFKNIKTINWIPDFQHIYLPEMFSNEEIANRNRAYMSVIKDSNVVVVSSNDTLDHLKQFAPNYITKTKVLSFVSQPCDSYHTLNEEKIFELKNKYKIENDFFYIPNQYWKHKNHILVFEAINQLKSEGLEISLVCSGQLSDYRNKSHIKHLQNYIKENKLSDYVQLHGLIDYEDVFGLINISKAVINPSLFEGWSSTVEECKSVDKNMILSDLNVHKEQYPSATFFERNSLESLKKILRDYQALDSGLNIDSLSSRTRKFADSYIVISKEVVQT